MAHLDKRWQGLQQLVRLLDDGNRILFVEPALALEELHELGHKLECDLGVIPQARTLV